MTVVQESGYLTKTAIFSLTGTVTAALISIHPVGGALFGGTFYLTGHTIGRFCEMVDLKPTGVISRTTVLFFSFLLCTKSAATVSSLCGFPITFNLGVGLSVGMLITIPTATVLAGGCLALSMMISGVYISRKSQE